MIVDPNEAVSQEVEYVLCEDGDAVLHNGARTPLAQLSDPESAFRRFCRSLDPNKTFILALVLDDADREVFYQAKAAAKQDGLHVQAPLDRPETLRAQWSNYQATRPAASEDEEPQDDEDTL